MNATSPTELAVALKTVLDENIVVCQLCCLSEGDAGDLGGDVLHCPQHDQLARVGEGVIELVLDHPAGPQPVGVRHMGFQGSWVTQTAVTNHNVAFDGRQLTGNPPSTNLRNYDELTELQNCKKMLHLTEEN